MDSQKSGQLTPDVTSISYQEVPSGWICVVCDKRLCPTARFVPDLMCSQTHIGSNRSASRVNLAVPPT